MVRLNRYSLMIKKILGYSFSTWFNAVLYIVLTPIAINLYSPYDYGVITYYYSIINIVFSFILLGLDQSYLRFYSEFNSIQRKMYFTQNIISTIILILLLCIITIPFSSIISAWLVDKSSFSIFPIFLCHLIGLTISRYFVIYFRLEFSLLKYTIFSLINFFLLKSVYLLGYPFGKDALTGITTTAVISILVALVVFVVRFKDFSLKGIFLFDNTCKNELKYALPIMPTILIAFINNNIPQIFLRSQTSFVNVAIFSVGLTIASSITLFFNGIMSFWEPYIFKNYKDQKDEPILLVNCFSDILYIICMIIILFQDFFFIFFNSVYINSLKFIPFLLTNSLLLGIGNLHNIGVKLYKKNSDNLYIYCVGTVLNACICYFFIPIYSCVGAAISSLFSTILMSLLMVIKGNKYYSTLTSYKNLICGTIILILIDFVNFYYFESLFRYIFTVSGIIIYIGFSKIYSRVHIVKYLS